MTFRFRCLMPLALAFAACGCATTRDSQDVAVTCAELLPASAPNHEQFIPDIQHGASTVIIHKQNARFYGSEHSRERYVRYALELPEGYERLAEIDINDPALKFRYTEGWCDGPWLCNEKQTGYIFVHRDTEDSVELCLDLKIQLRYGRTHSAAGPQSADGEAPREVTLRKYVVFTKNRCDAYASSNQMPPVGVAGN